MFVLQKIILLFYYKGLVVVVNEPVVIALFSSNYQYSLSNSLVRGCYEKYLNSCLFGDT